MFQHRLVVRYTQLSRVVSRRHIYPSEHQPICIRPSSPLANPRGYEIALTTATIQLQQLHRSLHSNVPTPPRSSLHTTLSSGLPPSHLSQRTPTNLHTPKFSSRQSSRLRDRVSISSTHRNGGVSFFGPITALHARHKRTLSCRELSDFLSFSLFVFLASIYLSIYLSI
ncbi:unnamed protein product [Acanthosepion pharaonis]|uniref:Uncharacterized protein n=1 Tax=Acanthosepion pharaonis TaxID=158019 RepID=A0A812D227_ACAPH|nr:unnamed protein product [Sepia pharaonis]